MSSLDYYEEPRNQYSTDEDDETVPFFKPEVPYRGDNKIIAKFRSLTPMQQSIVAIVAISCAAFWIILFVVFIIGITNVKYGNDDDTSSLEY